MVENGSMDFTFNRHQTSIKSPFIGEGIAYKQHDVVMCRVMWCMQLLCNAGDNNNDLQSLEFCSRLSQSLNNSSIHPSVCQL
mmetsp:Transcript_16205/g.24305  ORF Transcript_16205/g.24305 Transcript_16205/m.24305 type:complete len:82 (+) Transcript_16205:155-400(+)